MQKFLAGVGRALLFKGNQLIGVAKTLTDSTLNFSNTGEEIRGGAANALWGKYFHDSNLAVTLTDAMFNLEYVAASLGVNIESGGISVQEESLAVVSGGGSVTLSKTPIAFDGTLIGWYKLPADAEWSVGTITGTTMAIPGATANTTYCVKYFWQNADARQITIKTQYVPSELHVTIINDLWAGDITTDTSETTKIGRLITDIPRLQMDGNQDLALTSTGAATVSLTGSALAVSSTDTCEEDPYYGTMTEEIAGETWQSKVIALAIENGDISLATAGTETLIVRAVYGGMMASNRIPNSACTFVSSAEGAATVANTGVVTGVANGTAWIAATLTGYPSAAPGVVEVTVS